MGIDKSPSVSLSSETKLRFARRRVVSRGRSSKRGAIRKEKNSETEEHAVGVIDIDLSPATVGA